MVKFSGNRRPERTTRTSRAAGSVAGPEQSQFLVTLLREELPFRPVAAQVLRGWKVL